MKLPLPSFKRIFSALLYAQGKNGLLLQRLFWGILAGCLSTLFVADSPYLENLELSMLDYRYNIADKIATLKPSPTVSDEITLVTFDDDSQFELGIARFNDLESQKILAKAIEQIEKCNPSIIVLDLDLRGAISPELIKLFKRYRNVVLALFGSLEGSTDLPATPYLTYAAAFGYDELPRESNGLVCQLPISYREVAPDGTTSEHNPLAPVPSLTEAVIDLHRSIHGVGPDSHYLMSNADRPLYLGYRRWQYPSISLVKVFNGDYSMARFKNRIVMLGSTFTPRRAETAPGEHHKLTQPIVEIHADAISTLLDNKQISTFPPLISKLLILLLGGLCGGIASILNWGKRVPWVILSAVLLLILGQIAFQVFQLVMPIAPPLAVLTVCFVLGTFIYLDTDLRQRNRELAEARESMQVRAEEERQRIAEDLHDETLPALSAVARMADKLSYELTGNPIPGQMRERLDFSVTEMRRVINDLHPSVLETMGFKPALENLLATLSREGTFQTQFKETGGLSDERLSKFCKLQIYRIVQEALNNVQKHSQAANVELNITQKQNSLILSVIDDGKGMPAGSSKGESHGVLNIKQRAQLIGAKVDWRNPNRYVSGTEVRIELGLNGNRENG
jgi:signal transduction histidine kinase